MIEIGDTALTHGGKFHADDVFSAAFLKLLNPKIRIFRAFEVPADFSGIVFDIGGGEFDHHQEGAPVRENGVPYAAFGLLWREFGEAALEEFCKPENAAEEAARFDEGFVQPLDEDDNTGCGNALAGAVSAFNPAWDSEEDPDRCFARAVEFAEGILRRKFASAASVQRAKAFVERALSRAEERIVVLPRFAPWRTVLIPSPAEFVVYPSRRGGYSAQVIPAGWGARQAKCDFPAEWAGRAPLELQQISGVETLTFCHKARFLISAGKLEDAVRACRFAQEKAGEWREPPAGNGC